MKKGENQAEKASMNKKHKKLIIIFSLIGAFLFWL